MVDFNENIQYIKGVGEKKAKALQKLGISTLRDAVSYFPRAYEDRRRLYSIIEAPLDIPVCIKAMAADYPVGNRIRGGMEIVKFRAVDDSGSMDITYFNQLYLKDRFKPGCYYIFYGKVTALHGRRCMTNPEFEAEDKQGLVTGCLLPVYRLTAGIGRKTMSSIIRNALAACGDSFPDALPPAVAARRKLAQSRFSYYNIHFPSSDEALKLARDRLVYEELFVLAAALKQMRGSRSGQSGLSMQRMDPAEFYAELPFSPTGAQRRAISEAMADMASGSPMNRLLQGDVGSGKTLVAAALIWMAVKNGYQCAFMAPTEILAEQHYNTLSQMLAPYGIHVVKLTGSITARDKRETNAMLSRGLVQVAVGTHALISDAVHFQNLGLVVTDEQHRFGVEQRSALSEKGNRPHILVMSATPIPRTLALMIYGELELSVLDELPPGRQKVDTYAVGEDMRPRIEAFIQKLVSQGRQVFIVCPTVEEGEIESLKSAEQYAKELKEQIFPRLRIACVHGRMKTKEKDAVMAAVSRGEVDILVSTTVIEVGVDVPNAALMIVENADRFGLSQLHQLRGRVGRGQHKSYCILFSDAKGEEAKARLEVLCKTNDGFKISEADLQLRGPGDFFGARQHGLPEMHVADLAGDMRVLKQAQADAEELLKSDPELSAPENAPLKERIKQLFSANSGRFN